VINGKIYAVGGVGLGRRNTGAHEVYDPATDQWTTLAPLPTPRDHLAAAAVGGRLYAIGGRLAGSYAENVTVNEVYDPATNGWQTRAPLPTARSGIAAAVLAGKIFIFGGEAPSGTFHQVEAYEPTSDRWSTYTAMPTARHGLGAVALGGKIYVIAGGPTPGGSASSVNEIFVPK
jgi:N-acetylneuraminic acid mutarotase